jgi:hypothetical protein
MLRRDASLEPAVAVELLLLLDAVLLLVTSESNRPSGLQSGTY